MRLGFLLKQPLNSAVRYSRDRIKPICSGSIPNDLRWYPPRAYWEYLYFDERFQIPRNVNPGKAVGWGWMQQWRPRKTHDQFPKLIFTTSTNKKYGFKAFVVSERWYTKLHGAASQQYNYVTTVDPTASLRTDRLPNNLTPAGIQWLNDFREAGKDEEDLLHALAAFYNSSYGAAYAAQEEESMLLIPEISRADQLVQLARVARDLRDLHLVLNEVVLDDEGGAESHQDVLQQHGPLLRRLGLVGGKKNGPASKDLLDAAADLQVEVDELVEDLV